MFATSEKDRFTGIASETILCKKALPRLEKQHPKTNAGGCPRIFGLGGVPGKLSKLDHKHIADHHDAAICRVAWNFRYSWIFLHVIP